MGLYSGIFKNKKRKVETMKKIVQNLNLRNVKKGAVVRGLMMIIVIVNYLLNAMGINPIPIEESVIGLLVTVVLTVGTFLLSYWKNNSWTTAAQEADEKLQALRAESR